MPEYEVYALKFAGPFTSSGAFLMWLKDWEKVERRNYYIWSIKGGGETVVVDTGVSPDLAREKNLAGYISPAEVLSRIGVEADQRSAGRTHPFPLGSFERCNPVSEGHFLRSGTRVSFLDGGSGGYTSTFQASLG